jgi:hypothetical protein
VSERSIFVQVNAIKKSIQEASARVELARMPVNPLNQNMNSTTNRYDDDFYASESDRQALIIK